MNERKYDETGREKIRDYLKECEIVFDLGCGDQKIREDALGVDNVYEADYMFDLNSVISLKECDGICMSHFLEHIIDVRTFLDICYFALRPKGRIAIICPDGETVNPKNLGDSENTHEMLFTPKTIKIYLEHAGFKNVKSEYYDRPNSYKKTKGIFACGEK